MVDLARFFLDFTQKESCGKCVPCRLGTKRMLETLDRIIAGDGREGDIELLEEMGHYIIEGSLCALGGTAPEPGAHDHQVLPRRVRGAHPREALPGRQVQVAHHLLHRRRGAAPAARCAPRSAPPSCITGEKKQLHVIDVANCIKCDTCRQVCKFDAVKVRSGIEQAVAGAAIGS